MSLQRPQSNRLPITIGILLALLTFFAPQFAHADDCTPATGAYQKRYTNNAHASVQRMSKIVGDQLNPNGDDECRNAQPGQIVTDGNGNPETCTFAKIVDAKADYCMDKIEQAIDVITSVGNPKQIVMAIIESTLLNLLDQLCQTILSDINQIMTMGLSVVNQVCIPLPVLHLPGFSFKWGGHCNGTNLLPVTLGKLNPPPPPVPESPNTWQIWGGRVKGQGP